MIRIFIKSIVDSVIYFESMFISNRSNSPSMNKKRVLILRKDGLGDCIIFYPTLKAYRDFYKDAEITIIFPKYFEPLSPLLGTDLVNKVIWFDHKSFSSSYLYRRKFLLDLKRNSYDTAIYPVYSRETIGDLMMKMTHAKEIIGFDGDPSVQGERSKQKGDKSYTRLIRPPLDMNLELDRNVYFAEQITNIRPVISFPTIDTARLQAVEAEKILSANVLNRSMFAVIFPGSGAPYKIWPQKRWVDIVNYISRKGFTPVICGGVNEVGLVKDIISLLKIRVVDLSGKTDLATLAHILKRSRFYFGSDNGVLHLAVAVDIPCAAIVGSGSLGRFFPYGDRNKNIAVHNVPMDYKKGVWEDIKKMKGGDIHPSIEAITVANAKDVVDRLTNMII